MVLIARKEVLLRDLEANMTFTFDENTHLTNLIYIKVLDIFYLESFFK